MFYTYRDALDIEFHNQKCVGKILFPFCLKSIGNRRNVKQLSLILLFNYFTCGYYFDVIEENNINDKCEINRFTDDWGCGVANFEEKRARKLMGALVNVLEWLEDPADLWQEPQK
ncbi:Uncharacterized protein TCM_008720 [Theobroma cacao]|uniref:Uncharacterized protein n=1 Tax=Theobroma cacao TaxID=3641 RepID=A0A061EBZ5_THECC|nr:Uncharacterized protein TCM_008720 [Theobroma cacao]